MVRRLLSSAARRVRAIEAIVRDRNELVGCLNAKELKIDTQASALQAAWEHAHKLDAALQRLKGEYDALDAKYGALETAKGRELQAAWDHARELDTALQHLSVEFESLQSAESKELQAAADHAQKLDEALQHLNTIFWSADYNYDSLAVWNKNLAFLHDPKFMRAYFTGMNSGHKFGLAHGVEGDIHLEWRTHVICWAAWHARHLPGSYVECGVNTGMYALAACHFVDFNATGKDFYLFDTFSGIPEEQMTERERSHAIENNQNYYEECYEVARRNFASFPRARLVRGVVPDSLTTVEIDEVCYLSIDMNILKPEIAALEFFWDKLVPESVVVLDDYGWSEHSLQQEEMDKFAAARGVKILLLPTGQGLIFKR